MFGELALWIGLDIICCLIGLFKFLGGLIYLILTLVLLELEGDRIILGDPGIFRGLDVFDPKLVSKLVLRLRYIFGLILGLNVI